MSIPNDDDGGHVFNLRPAPTEFTNEESVCSKPLSEVLLTPKGATSRW
jgi:hypothetical protein